MKKVFRRLLWLMSLFLASVFLLWLMQRLNWLTVIPPGAGYAFPAVAETSDIRLPKLKLIASDSLGKLCRIYSCPDSPYPGKSYEETALGKIHFVETGAYMGVVGVDAVTRPAFANPGYPGEIFFFVDYAGLAGLSEADYFKLTSLVMDHEVVHQAAIQREFFLRPVFTIEDESFGIAESSGLALSVEEPLDSEKAPKAVETFDILNETFVYWFADTLDEESTAGYFSIGFREESRFLNAVNSDLGLNRVQLFPLYTNYGWPALAVAYGQEASIQALIKTRTDPDKFGFYVLYVMGRCVKETRSGNFSFEELKEAVFYFMESGERTIC